MTFVVAKDSKDGYVLLGGLGAMGLGEMWIKEEERHKDYSGYLDAPERSSVKGFGRATPEEMADELCRSLQNIGV